MTAREALVGIRSIILSSDGHLVDGGLELSINEFKTIIDLLNSSLGDIHVQD
jgi:hypothetical protein